MAPSGRESQHACRTPLAAMETTDEQPLPQAQGLGFQVLHYHRSSLDPDSPLIIHLIGIYHTFALAHAAALSKLQRTLNDYLRIGYYGRYCDLIDCRLRGLITVCKESMLDGYMLMREIPMSEFRLETLKTRHDASEAAMRLANETSQPGNPHRGPITNTQVAGTAWPAVKLPTALEQHKEPATPKRIAKRGEQVVMHEFTLSCAEFPPPGAQYDEERQPEWSQTRIPLFDRRDDGPFRRAGEKQYAQVMAFWRAAPTPCTRPVQSDSGHDKQ